MFSLFKHDIQLRNKDAKRYLVWLVLDYRTTWKTEDLAHITVHLHRKGKFPDRIFEVHIHLWYCLYHCRDERTIQLCSAGELLSWGAPRVWHCLLHSFPSCRLLCENVNVFHKDAQTKSWAPILLFKTASHRFRRNENSWSTPFPSITKMKSKTRPLLDL